MRNSFRRFLPALVLPLALVACDSGTGPRDSGSMSILLTDAPGDFENAIVTISSIELLREGDDGDGQDGAGSRVILLDEPVTVDLLTLQNEVMDLTGDVVVPGGRYSQLRIVITDGLITVEQEDGSVLVYASSDAFAESQGYTRDGDLQMPSFGQSGLKINLPPDMRDVDGGDYPVLVDFNVAESFGHQAGNSGKWVLHPVIHATNFTQAGALRLGLRLADGITLPIINDVQVTLAMLSGIVDKNGDMIPATFADADGDGTFHASFGFLAPGSYPISLGLVDGLVVTTDPALPLTLQVTAGHTTEQLITILTAGTQ